MALRVFVEGLAAPLGRGGAARRAGRVLATAVGAAAGLVSVRPALLEGAAPVPEGPDLLSRVLEDARAGVVDRVLIGPDALEVVRSDSSRYTAPLVPWLDVAWIAEKLHACGVAFGTRPPSHVDAALAAREARQQVLKAVVAVVAPCAYLAFAYKVLMRAYKGPADASVARRYRKKRDPRPASGFAGVAGVDAAKAELVEVVDILRAPEKFAAMGARVPRGVLLTGPSGTGKTLLAKAVADEADCAFLSCSASAFVELLVGRGAARVRDLFRRARALAPCVVFIDEIDAIAKARGLLGQSDEREQTLNQILCELDGFDAKVDEDEKLVILLAATNRPEILDAALVRPGRLDRCVLVPLPAARGRAAILELHARRVPQSDAVDFGRVARQASGFSGADLANVVNEAALFAIRADADRVNTRHLLAAVAKTRAGKAAVGDILAEPAD